MKNYIFRICAFVLIVSLLPLGGCAEQTAGIPGVSVRGEETETDAESAEETEGGTENGGGTQAPEETETDTESAEETEGSTENGGTNSSPLEGGRVKNPGETTVDPDACIAFRVGLQERIPYTAVPKDAQTVWLFRTREEYASWLASSGYGISGETTDDWDEAYFEDGALICLLLVHSSGSARDTVDFLEKTDETLTVRITTVSPWIGTDDMALWAIVLEVAQEDVADAEDIRLSVQAEFKGPSGGRRFFL